MNAKELIEWLEERGELVVSKADGGHFVVVARQNGVMKTAEAATLERAIQLWEEM